MKLTKNKWAIAAALVAVSFCGAANATPTTWTDVIDFRPDRLVTEHKPVVFTHTVENFVPFVDQVNSYKLKFDLYDDRDTAKEVALFSQLGDLFGTQYFNLSGSEMGGWTFWGALQIEVTGTLTVAISALKGDFYIGSSTLTVYGDKKSRTSVPEPTTLALFGAALLGFGVMRRRRQSV